MTANLESVGLPVEVVVEEADADDPGYLSSPVHGGDKSIRLQEIEKTALTEGYFGFYADFRFNADGKFIAVGFWE
jgi:hypothetical protein